MSKDLKVILGIIAGLIALAALWYIQTVIIYILVSAILALIGLPLKRLIQRLRIGNWRPSSSLAAGISLIVMVGVIVYGISKVTPVVVEQVSIISSLDINRIADVLVDAYTAVRAKLPFISSNNTMASKESLVSTLSSYLDFSEVTALFTGIVGVLGNVVVAFFSILFITFFFLKDFRLFKQIFFLVTPSKYEHKVQSVLSNAKNLLTRYFVGIIIQITAITTLVSIGLGIVGVKNAIFIAVFAGLINVIPYIGPLIGTSVGVFLAISGNLHFEYTEVFWPFTLQTLSVFLFVQMLDNFLFQPVIFSSSVKAHPLEIFVLILVAGTVGGILGMVLAIPLYTMVRIIAKEFLSQFKVVQTITKNI